MSQVVITEPVQTSLLSSSAGRRPDSSSQTRSVLLWSIAACLMLTGSGVIRSVQTQIFEEGNSYNVQSPFALKDIPKTLDGWSAVAGSTSVLDPLTTRITGSTDHTIVNYYNEETGTILQVMLLFGPAEPVLPHTPEVCYTATGFKATGPGVDRDITVHDQVLGKFRSVVYGKSGGRAPIQETAYHSFWYDGEWMPWVNMRNTPRKNPGIFKLQIQRSMTMSESRFQDEPIEDFLEKFLPLLDKMIVDSMSAQSEKSEKSR